MLDRNDKVINGRKHVKGKIASLPNALEETLIDEIETMCSMSSEHTIGSIMPRPIDDLSASKAYSILYIARHR